MGDIKLQEKVLVHFIIEVAPIQILKLPANPQRIFYYKIKIPNKSSFTMPLTKRNVV